jgi:hypothetical protein
VEFSPGGPFLAAFGGGRRTTTARRLASLAEACVVFEVVLKEPAGA